VGFEIIDQILREKDDPLSGSTAQDARRAGTLTIACAIYETACGRGASTAHSH